MVSHEFGTLGVEFDGLGYAQVDAGKVVFIKVIAFEHIAILQNTLFAEFLFWFQTHNKPC